LPHGEPNRFGPAERGEDDGQPDFLDKVEQAITDTTTFVDRFVRTLAYATFRPSRLSGDIWREQLARPYTFLAICALVAVRGLRRVALFFVLVASVPLACDGRDDTSVLPSLPPLAREIAQYADELLAAIEKARANDSSL
jgi:hypothetical protein